MAKSLRQAYDYWQDQPGNCHAPSHASEETQPDLRAYTWRERASVFLLSHNDRLATPPSKRIRPQGADDTTALSLLFRSPSGSPVTGPESQDRRVFIIDTPIPTRCSGHDLSCTRR